MGASISGAIEGLEKASLPDILNGGNRELDCVFVQVLAMQNGRWTELDGSCS